MKQSARLKTIKVEAQTLRIHPYAQRELIPSRLKELNAGLDLDVLGVMYAVEYTISGETAVWIIDGQHRWRALMDQGLSEWLCEVKVYVDVKDDARASALFLKLNNRAPMHPFAKFDNERRAGYQSAVGITKIAADHELKISRQSSDKNLTCVTALGTVFNFDGGVTLSATLDTVIAAWGRKAAALEGKLIEGVGVVFKTFNGNIERPILVKKLAKYPGGASGLLGDARGLRKYRNLSISRCIAERVVELYNAGRRNGRLDWV